MIRLTVEQRFKADALDSSMIESGIDPRRGGMGAHYDRDGEPISFGEFAVLCEVESYRRVDETTTPGGRFWVSTIWLGMDHGFGHGLKLFETMVQKRGPDSEWVDQIRYATEAEAMLGHRAMVVKFSADERGIN